MEILNNGLIVSVYKDSKSKLEIVLLKYCKKCWKIQKWSIQPAIHKGW
jgi:hypothetical protein